MGASLTRTNAAAARLRVGTGEELDLVGAVGPEMCEADDRAVADRDERVEPGIGALPVQAGDDVGGRRAGDALMLERAGVQELGELDDVVVRCGTNLEELGHADPFARSASSRRGSATRRSEEAWNG